MRFLSLLLLSIPFGGSSSASHAVASDALLRSVPKGAFAVVSASDLDGLRATAEKNAWWKLSQDPALTGLRPWIDENVLAELAEPSAAMGVDPLEFARAIHGSVAMFAALDASQHMCGGFLIEPGEDHAAFDGFVDVLRGKLGVLGTLENESYADFKLLVVTKTPDTSADAEGAGSGSATHIVVLEGKALTAVVGGESRDATLALAHGVIDRYAGTNVADGLDTNPLWVEAQKSAREKRRLELFVDLPRVLAFAEQESPPTDNDRKVIDALGLPGFGWLHGSADVGEGERIDMAFALRLPEKGYIRRWVELLGTMPRNLARMAPRESVSLGLGSFDVAALYRSAWELAAEVAPDEQKAARAQFDQVLQSMGGLDPEAHFIAQLTGEFASFVVTVSEEEWLAAAQAEGALPEGSKPRGPWLGSAYVIGLKDPETVEVFLEDALETMQMGELVDTEEIEGQTVYQLEIPGGFSLGWAFTAKHALVSAYPSALRGALKLAGDEKASSALDNEAFKAQLAAFPQASALSVALASETLKGSISGIEAAVLMVSKSAAGAADVPSPLDGFTPAIIDRYFKGTMVSTVAREGSILRMSFAAR